MVCQLQEPSLSLHVGTAASVQADFCCLHLDVSTNHGLLYVGESYVAEWKYFYLRIFSYDDK